MRCSSLILNESLVNRVYYFPVTSRLIVSFLTFDALIVCGVFGISPHSASEEQLRREIYPFLKDLMQHVIHVDIKCLMRRKKA